MTNKQKHEIDRFIRWIGSLVNCWGALVNKIKLFLDRIDFITIPIFAFLMEVLIALFIRVALGALIPGHHPHLLWFYYGGVSCFLVVSVFLIGVSLKD
jgi:hypothetical protein